MTTKTSPLKWETLTAPVLTAAPKNNQRKPTAAEIIHKSLPNRRAQPMGRPILFKDLCVEEKQKLAHICDTVNRMHKEKIVCERQYQQLKDEYTETVEKLVEKNKSLEAELESLKSKWTQSTSMIKNYQEKLDKLITHNLEMKYKNKENTIKLKSEISRLRDVVSDLERKHKSIRREYNNLKSQEMERNSRFYSNAVSQTADVEPTLLTPTKQVIPNDVLSLKTVGLSQSYKTNDAPMNAFIQTSLVADSETESSSSSTASTNSTMTNEDSLVDIIQILEEQQTFDRFSIGKADIIFDTEPIHEKWFHRGSQIMENDVFEIIE